MLWQVFRLIISFSVFSFCLSKEWNQVFEAAAMFLLFMLLSIVEPAVKEEMYICIETCVDRQMDASID